MNKNDIMAALPNSVTRAMGKTSLTLQKNAPAIFTGVSIAAAIAAVVIAIKNTPGYDIEVEETKDDLEKLKAMRVEFDEDVYSKAEEFKNYRLTYAAFGLNTARRYALPATLLGVSIAAQLMAHGIMKERNAAVIAAWSLTERSFHEYRSRVKEEYGEEKDIEYFYGAEKKKITVQTMEDGKKKKTKKDVLVFSDDLKMPSIYSVKFDEHSAHWKRSMHLNQFFVAQAQNWFNNELERYGHVTLNSVYDYFDIPRTKVGMIVGWLRDDVDNGDGYIEIGMAPSTKEDYAEGEYILLDFNVQGDIHNLI